MQKPTMKFTGLILFIISLNFPACTGESAEDPIPAFNHVMLYVFDLDHSILFYQEAFGLMEYKRLRQLEIEGVDEQIDTVQVNMAFLRFQGSDFILELSERSIAEDSSGTDRLFQHIGIEVKDIEHSSMRALGGGAVSLTGIRKISADSITAKTAFFSGPDGERIELMQIIQGDF